MKGFLLLDLVFCLMILSCKESNQNTISENTDRVDKILIQFYPSFHEPSLMLLDLSTNQLAFHRLGTKEYYQPIESPRSILWKQAPKSIVFQLDSTSYNYLNDSISYNSEDFKDREEDCTDGIWHTVFYILRNGKFEDVDLKNSLTENEYKLIVKLIDLSINQSTDSITTSYLKNLKNYHH